MLKYPLFILVKDDSSIRVIGDSKNLNHMEMIDIKEGLYSGWDFDGYPFKVLWDQATGIKLEQTSEQPQLDKKKEAVFNYIDRSSVYYRPDKQFIYDNDSNDFIGIIGAMKQHIKDAPFKQRVVNFLRRF